MLTYTQFSVLGTLVCSYEVRKEVLSNISDNEQLEFLDDQ